MINLLEIQQAIWTQLNKITDYTVVDYIEFDSIEPPFIALGRIYFDDNGVKNNDGTSVTQYINLYSTYSGKKEIMEMVNEVNKIMENVNIEGHSVHVKQKHISIIVDKDRFSSIFQRMDRNNNKFYHAVLEFEINIY